MTFSFMRGLLTALAALVLSFSFAPVHAHTDLESTSPKDGQTLKSAPQRVSLTFGESLLDGGYRLVAQNAAGEKVELDAAVDGSDISAPWPQTESSGRYKVSYRVVAEDGHPLEGAITFTIAASAASASPQPVDAASPPVSPAPQEQTSGGGFNPLLPVLLVAAVLVAGFFIWRARGD